MDTIYSDPQYSEAVDAYISMAIEYGIEIGLKQAFEDKIYNKKDDE
jgi:hypothetical protein